MKFIISESQYRRIIKENKPDGDPPKTVEEIKAFQDWMDRYYPTWLNGGKLNKGSGYGTFGPKTKKAWDEYGISYTFQVGGRSKADIEDFFNPNQMCKRKFNNEELKKAITWWKNWLADPITVEKFKKNYGLNDLIASFTFSAYNDVLNRIYLEHVMDIPSDIPKNNIAWVEDDIRGKSIYELGNQKIPIFINCRNIDYVDDIQATLIHEIQHILNTRKPLGNQEELGVFDKAVGMVGAYLPSSKWVDLLVKNGFNKSKSEKIAKDYINILKTDTVHISVNNEILSNLFEVRHFLNLKPGQNITKQMIFNNLYKHQSIIMLIFQWMFSGEKDFQLFIDKWNLTAKKEIEKGNEDKYV